ncbi:hypothetical protein D3C81_144770 [compost metagenome]|jgi:hypothetical protein
MYNLKGFMVFAPLADNAVNVIAPLGELSTHCATFSKEKGQYISTDYKDSKLISLLSQDVATNGTKTLQKVPAAHQAAALNLGQWIYAKAIASEIRDDRPAFESSLINQFGTLMQDLACGELVTDGVRWMPEWISYKLVGQPDNRVRIWFADDSLRRQYDEYEIAFVPPIAKLDDFFRDPNEVKALVDAYTLSAALEKGDTVKGRNPETVMINKIYKYYAQKAPFINIDTNWLIIVWGPAGNNPDIIKQELAKWILANSQHTEEEWMDIFPDIFTSTEFIATPFWDNIAIEQKAILTGVYSPTMLLTDIRSKSLKTIKGKNYTTAHIDQNLVVSGFQYSSLCVSICGGPYNRGGVKRFDDQWPKYINVSTGSPDANRMDLATQNWLDFFIRMLIVAESATLYSDMPIGMSRVTRDGIVYIASTFEDILYLVVTKYTMMDVNI